DAAQGVILAVLHVYGQTVAPMLHEPSCLAGTKGTAAADEEEGFEKARLAGAVRPEEIIAARVQRAVDVLEDPQSVDSDSLQRHASAPRPRLRRARRNVRRC